MRRFWMGVAVLGLLLAGLGCPSAGPKKSPAPQAATPLQLVVMDPLSDQLACACVAGYAQRKYDRLGEFLSARLRRPVEITYAGSVGESIKMIGRAPDLVIGKQSVVLADARSLGLPLNPFASLTGKNHLTMQSGLFVVRSADPARGLGDLNGKRILFGPVIEEEKSAAALAALERAGVTVPQPLEIRPACNIAAKEVADGKADVAVISEYALPLLEGCGTIEKGSLRIVGRTALVPFITLFVNAETVADSGPIARALDGVSRDTQLLADLESAAGFIRLALPSTAPSADGDNGADSAGWPDWRGPNRDGQSGWLPRELPKDMKSVWEHPTTGPGLAGIAATDRFLVVADKDAERRQDIFRCLDAQNGRELWTLAYAAAQSMDYSDAPRATPLIRDGRVYTLGALGDLHALELASGRVLWKRNLARDFSAEVPKWGYCSTPLLVEDRLIVNPGSAAASVVALDVKTGNVLWSAPGSPAAYSSFIVATLGGVRQVIGYDAEGISGYDVATGRRLWRLEPRHSGDFNVPTPLAIDGRLLLATENNGARLYEFAEAGAIRPEPVATNPDLSPDTSSPVIAGGRVFGFSGGIACLDLPKLATRYQWKDGQLGNYASLIASGDRVLVTTIDGELILLDAASDQCRVISRQKLFPEAEIYSHPALVGHRYFVRTQDRVACFSLDGPASR